MEDEFKIHFYKNLFLNTSHPEKCKMTIDKTPEAMSPQGY